MALPSDQDASGRSFDEREWDRLRAVLASGMLTSTKGQVTRALEQAFAGQVGQPHATACSSGSAAIHAAVAALDLEPGDEIITSPITDMGALATLLLQGVIPVFADVDPDTGNLTPATVEARLSERTRAVMATHLFGRPCDLRALAELAHARGLALIEDCAQAYGALHHGRPVGAWGDLACFSLQQGKHITCGEGGVVLSRDPARARRAFLFINKAWGYGDAQPDHYFAAPNYRISELQSAVALAQWEKLPDLMRARQLAAERLSAALQGTPGLTLPAAAPGDTHGYWRYPLIVDDSCIRGGAVGLARRLREREVLTAPRYIQKPAFQCAVFRDQRTFGRSRYPFTLARAEAVDYRPALFPGAFRYLDRVLVVPLNERYTAAHVDYVAAALRVAAGASS